MSAREPITESLVQRLLLGMTPGEWKAVKSSIRRGGMLVAPSGIVGGIRNEADLAFSERAPDIAEWALREMRHRDRQLAEKNRRIAELEARLDAVTATEDDEPSFATEMADATKEH